MSLQSVYIEKETDKELTEAAKKWKCSKGAIVRVAIRKYLGFTLRTQEDVVPRNPCTPLRFQKKTALEASCQTKKKNY